MLFYKANEPLGNHIKKIIISRKSQPPVASCQPPVASRQPPVASRQLPTATKKQIIFQI